MSTKTLAVSLLSRVSGIRCGTLPWTLQAPSQADMHPVSADLSRTGNVDSHLADDWVLTSLCRYIHGIYLWRFCLYLVLDSNIFVFLLGP
ncbi:hypothetical protein LX32DRAFT_635678 [Colletotrichum zoysiae]|uniref:Uncharacterized protein n=1 Tax=Colletotrichum zoysiae TaxID=1216348 RepID=A0AAD9HQ73_9PEZI|nr:hypothetical protein LX32DRAFT_635678 [Colletotrichum zoysiae]